MRSSCDVAIVGAGIIGASAAYYVSQHCSVMLIEQEPHPGYHSSGRSAAVLLPPYGGQIARALTRASSPSLMGPAPGFTDAQVARRRGALLVASEEQLELMQHWRPRDAGAADEAHIVSRTEAVTRVPILRPEKIAAAVWLPAVHDLDAAALLQAFIRGFRARGGELRVNSEVRAIERTEGSWLLQTMTGTVRARTLINAAGAWADQVAGLAGIEPAGVVPMRRTMVIVDPPTGVDTRNWPLVADVAETFYFKPEAGRLVVSPADRSPVAPQDIHADDFDVAVAVDRLEAATTIKVGRVMQSWAGLRPTTADAEPIIGFDPREPSFLWAVGFAGFGIQAAHAAGRCCEALITGDSRPADLSAAGVDLARLSIDRLRVDQSGAKRMGNSGGNSEQ